MKPNPVKITLNPVKKSSSIGLTRCWRMRPRRSTANIKEATGFTLFHGKPFAA